MSDQTATISTPFPAPAKPAPARSGAHQAHTRGAHLLDAAAHVGAERAQPAGVRGHGHVRRILSRPPRLRRARRRLAGVSLGDARPAVDQQRDGRRRLVGGRARGRRRKARARQRARLPRLPARARARRDLLDRDAARRADPVSPDGRAGRHARRRARLRQRGAGRRRRASACSTSWAMRCAAPATWRCRPACWSPACWRTSRSRRS